MSEPIFPPAEHEQLVEEFTPVVRAAARHRPPPHRQPWLWCLLAGGLVAVAAYIVLWEHSSGNARDASLARSQAADARSEAAQANGVAQALASQVRHLGGVPVATPATGVPGPRGPRGADVTDAQTQAAVQVVCTTTPSLCQQPVSLARLRAAVQACFTAKRCPAPKDGQSGAAGPSGATGARGPGPTAQQIADGWADWCSSHECTGPAGPKGDTGDTGPKGSTGRGIASIDCTGLGVDQLVIHYDDGTDQAVPCNLNPTSGAPTS